MYAVQDSPLTAFVDDTPPNEVTVPTLLALLSLVNLDSSILQLSTYLPQGHLKCHYRDSKASLGDCDLGTYKLHGLLRPLILLGWTAKRWVRSHNLKTLSRTRPRLLQAMMWVSSSLLHIEP